MEKSELFDAIARTAVESEVGLLGSVMTKFVVMAEFALPSGGFAFHRMTGSADGRSLMTWEVDGFLWTALTQGRRMLGPLTDS